MSQRFDVIAVDMKTLAERVIAENKTEADAGAVMKLAIMRRGVDQEFYTMRPRLVGIRAPSQ
jgi:hypothetical protein